LARQTREQLRRLQTLTEAQAALGWGVILILAALVGTIYVSQASRIATVGRRVQILQNDLENLKRENTTLERKIAEIQSLDRLQQEAIRLGFVPAQPDDIEYIIVPEYPVNASESTSFTPPPVATLTPPPETIGDALWLYVSSRISDFIHGEAREQ
jgi:cell division protein FtsL